LERGKGRPIGKEGSKGKQRGRRKRGYKVEIKEEVERNGEK
jgi:hypothetical protein